MATTSRPEVVPAKPEATSPPAIADPGPLGLAAFAMTTFVLSVFNANIIGAAALLAVVLPLALFYGGAVQILAGMWEFRKNNTFGALAFSSYGAFWITFAWYVRYVAPGLPTAREHEAAGLFLLAWTIFTAYMLLASFRTTMVLSAVFTVLFATFLMLTIGYLAAPPNATVIKAGGWLGLVTALLAWYASAAGVTNATWGGTPLPVFPWKK
jgi:uncharacterized protein